MLTNYGTLAYLRSKSYVLVGHVFTCFIQISVSSMETVEQSKEVTNSP